MRSAVQDAALTYIAKDYILSSEFSEVVNFLDSQFAR